MPFDQFTIEQLAGDLLPNPTVSQRVATGFHRNMMTNDEGGADPDEYLSKYMVDRVSTTGIGLAGQTVGCARMSRSQIRSDQAKGVLPALRVLP